MKRPRPRWSSVLPSLLLLAGGLLAGCASSGESRDDQIKELQNRVLELQRKTAVADVELARLRQQVAELMAKQGGVSSISPGGAAAPGAAFFLRPTADDQLIFLDRHVELIAGETRNRQGDPQALRLAVLAGNPLDVVRWISVGSLRDAIKGTLDFVESKQERAGQRRNSRHVSKPSQATLTGSLRHPPRPSGICIVRAGRSSPIWGVEVKASRMLENEAERAGRH